MHSAIRIIVVGLLTLTQFARPAYGFPDSGQQSTSTSTRFQPDNSLSVPPGPLLHAVLFKPWFSGDAPVAVPDSYDVTEDVPLTVDALSGVLANDTDPESDPLIVDLPIAALPTNGNLSINADGSFTYTPDANFNGVDSFQYQALDDTPSPSNLVTVTLNVAAVNDAPIAINDADTTTEDTVLDIAAPGVLANDSDIDLDPISVDSFSQPTHGSVNVQSDGAYTYTPNLDFNGSDSFTYTITDGNGGSDTATVTLTITAVNDAPVAVDDSASTDEDTPLTVAAPGVLVNDSDVDSSITAVLVTPPATGTLMLNANGSFTYTPAANANGVVTFTYRAYDGEVYSSPATVTITINAVNDPPIAAADNYAATEDTPLNVAAPGVLANDSDVEGPLTAVLLTPPATGTLIFNADGSFNYTPAANANGVITFTYRAYDGSVYTSATTVTITIAAVNDAPVAANDSYAATEDTPLNVAAPGVLANDSDIEGSALTAVLLGPPATGTLTLNANGSFNYTPALNVNGPVTFTYRAYDGDLYSSPATVTINIAPQPDAPIAAADNLSTVEDTAFTFPATALLNNDSDPDGETLTVTNLSQPSHGTLTDNQDNTYTYTPDLNYFGTDTFTYRATDPTSRHSSPTTVTITISAVNDAPIAVDDSYTATEDVVLNVAVAAGLLANDSDVDSSLTAVLLAPPASGSLSIDTNGSFIYTPAANANGVVTFTYRAYDGEIYSSPATVTITITAVNDAPVAVDDSASTDEDTPLTVTAPGVLANDSDVESSITAVLLDPPATGVLNLNANGSYTYTPAANINGVVTFTYRAYDGSLYSAPATVTITINPVPDAPVANPDSFTTDEDTALVILESQLIANDSDGDNDPLDVTAFTQPTHGTLVENPTNTFTYTPSANYFGTDSFTYTIFDGTSTDTATVTITINAVNDPPIAAADNYAATEDTPLNVAAPGVLANDSDVEGPLTAVLLTPPATGTLIFNADGSFNYTPAANANGVITFTYRAYDGSVYTSATTVTITIAAVNDAPVAANDSYAATEDTPLNVAAPGVLANDSDIEGSALTAVLLGPPATGTLTLNANGSFNYTPALNVNGPVTFTYRAYDGDLYSSPATVTINIAAVNDAPVAVNDVGSTNEDVPLTIAAPGVLSNDSDVDSPITAVLLSPPATGTLNLNSNGGFTYTPAANANGVVTFTYRAYDGSLYSAAATVTITVNAVNDNPVAVADTYAPTEDTPFTVTAPGVLGNDSDVDNDPLTAVHVTGSGPTHGTLTLQSTGDFTYTPDLNFNGTDQFSYYARDGQANSNTVVVTLNVTSVNDQPVAEADAYSTSEDTALNVTAPGVLQNDTDVDSGTTLTAVLVTPPSSGSLTLNANGSFLYTPAANFNGEVTFTYRANDGSGQPNNQSAPATVTITITPVNDPPVANDQTINTPEDTPRTLVLSVSDIDTAVLQYTIPARSAHGTISGTAPNLTYTPDTNYFGVDSFTYTVSDGFLSDEATVTINVSAVNDPPVGVADTYTTNEDTVLSVTPAGVLANDSDVDNTVLTASLVTAPTRGTLTLNSNGSFTYTPNLNINGQDTFTYRVSDGSAFSPPVTVTLNITPVNDLPVAQGENFTTNEDTPLVIAAPGILANDTDVDGDTLTAILVTAPIRGTLTPITNGSFVYTPTLNVPFTHAPVDDTFTYRVFDGTASSAATVTARITINEINDPPYHDTSKGSFVYDVGQDGYLVVSALEGLKERVADVENDAFTIHLASDTDEPNDVLIVNSDGSFSYTPYPNMPIGEYTFTFRAVDNQPQNNQSDEIEVTLNIISPGAPQVYWNSPVSTGNRLKVGTGEIFTFTVQTSDCEPGCGVRYFRWDAVNHQFIPIGQSETAPYTVSFDTSVLNNGYNEILAVAVDTDNGFSSSPRRNIWLWRYPWSTGIHRIYMPGVSR